MVKQSASAMSRLNTRFFMCDLLQILSSVSSIPLGTRWRASPKSPPGFVTSIHHISYTVHPRGARLFFTGTDIFHENFMRRTPRKRRWPGAPGHRLFGYIFQSPARLRSAIKRRQMPSGAGIRPAHRTVLRRWARVMTVFSRAGPRWHPSVSSHSPGRRWRRPRQE